VGERSFARERITAPDVGELQTKIHCAYDEALEFNPSGFASHFRPSAMTLTTTDGRRYSREIAAPRGSTINPLSEQELLAKFHKWMGMDSPSEAREKVAALVRELEHMNDVSELMSLV
jgi:2-methylcitrate dehydratase PrpD